MAAKLSFKELLDELQKRYDEAVGEATEHKPHAVSWRRSGSAKLLPLSRSLTALTSLEGSQGEGAARPSLLSKESRLSSFGEDSVTLQAIDPWPIWQEGTRKDVYTNPSGNDLKFDASSTVRGGDLVRSEGILAKLVMRPDSKLRVLWDILSVLVLVADITFIPLVMLPLGNQPMLETASLTITAFWAMDIFVSFLSGYHDLGFVEMRPSKIAKRYLGQWFVLDLTCVTMDLVMAVVQSAASDVVGLARFGKIARVSRLMRLVRLLRAVKVAKTMSALNDYIHSATLLTAVGVTRIVLGILMTCHYIACLWYYAGTLEEENWLEKLARHDIGYVYVTALHWSITQFTPASMEINPQNAYERAFAIVTIIVGLVAFSSFVSSITAAMAALHKTREARMKQTGDIRRYIIENRLSLGLGSSIMAFVKAYDFNAQIRLHEADLPLFSVLPESIRVRLRWEIYQPFLARYPLFEHLCSISDRGVVTICNGSMSERSLVLSQDLFTADEEATSMYFVVHGTLEYFHGWDDTHLKELSQDEWICEVSLWAKWEHGGRVAALTPSEVMVLNAGSFRRIGGRFPEIQAPCCIYASQYIKRIRTAQHDQPVDIWCDKVECAQIVQSAIAKLDTGASAAGPRTVAQAWSKVNEKESPAAPVIS